MTTTIPARLKNSTPHSPSNISTPYTAIALFGLELWDRVELDWETDEVDDDPDPDPDVDEADDDAEAEGEVAASVAFPTSPTPNALVDSPSKRQLTFSGADKATPNGVVWEPLDELP